MVKSADRTLAILSVLAAHSRPVPTMTVARECGIPKSSTHHLLNVMRRRHFVTYYEAERAWGLGVSAFEIGSAYLRSRPLQRLGRPLLAELSRGTGETAHLGVLHGTEVLYLDKETPAIPGARLVTEVGVRLPAHLTAIGRALLAPLPAAQVRALYGQTPLVRRTGRGPVSVGGLLRELRETRAAGYAEDREMVTPGIACVAAAAWSHEEVPVAALGVTFVAASRTRPQVEEAARAVVAAADRLTEALGGRTSAERAA